MEHPSTMLLLVLHTILTAIVLLISSGYINAPTHLSHLLSSILLRWPGLHLCTQISQTTSLLMRIKYRRIWWTFMLSPHSGPWWQWTAGNRCRHKIWLPARSRRIPRWKAPMCASCIVNPLNGGTGEWNVKNSYPIMDAIVCNVVK